MKYKVGNLPRLLSMLLLLLLCVQTGVQAAAIREGSSGDEVKEVQTKLKRWGYYYGEVDGRFGAGTKEAVIAFQRKNGLNADGVVGASTAKALGLKAVYGASSNQSASKEEDKKQESKI